MQKIISAFVQAPVFRQLGARYQQLSSKDQNILIGLGILIVIALFYVLLWSPLHQWSETQMNDYSQQVETKDWMQKYIGKARDIENKKKSGVGQRELSTVVASIAKHAGITINRIQPDKKGVAVWLEDAAYQKTLAWLVVLETKYQVVVQQIKLDRLQEEGRIKGYIHLREG